MRRDLELFEKVKERISLERRFSFRERIRFLSIGLFDSNGFKSNTIIFDFFNDFNPTIKNFLFGEIAKH